MNQQNDIINLLRDKSGLIQYLLKTIMDADKHTNGLMNMKSRGFSNEGMLENVIKVTAMQAGQMKVIALVALLLAQSADFDTMVAQLLNKMGRGEEALKAMWDAKMKGNWR